MRNNQNKYRAGRRNSGHNPHSKFYESTGPDVKVRGTASNIAEKYQQLARDAHTSGKTLAAYKKLSLKARAAKDFPLAHALFALATFVAVGGKVLAETPDTKLDFARQFDIGAGRKLFLECRGVAPAGYPTVVLIAGYHGSSDSWDALSLLPLAVGPAVLPGLARENRVCAYDRPGTVRDMAYSPLTATPQVFATGSDHNIQLSQPDLVINTTRLVISRAAAASTNNR
jgi:hypothetical protein